MLRDLRVLDLTDERGFLAGKILADLAADVIKIEAPGGDATRDLPPFLGCAQDRERSLPWLALNTSKRGITLDLTLREGREIFSRLVGESDVVLHNLAGRSLEARRLGFEELLSDNPAIVACAMTPYGQDGPYAAHRAHDLVMVAMGGNAIMTGEMERPPVRCSMPTSYYHAAPEAVLGILMAIHAQGDAESSKGGEGRFVDVSMRECQLATLITGAGRHQLDPTLSRRSGARLGRTREIWQVKDGYVSFGLRGGPTRIPNLIATRELMEESGAAPDWLIAYDWQDFNPAAMADDEIERFETAFGDFFKSRTMRELYDEALARRILLAPCNDAREILAQRQLRDRDLFVTLDYPELGASIEHPAFFAKSNAFDMSVRSRAPRIGEHNHEVYSELGLEDGAIRDLRVRGVI